MSQLYGRAIDLAKRLSSEEIESEEGARNVANAVHKKDVLSVETDNFHRFLDVLRTKLGENESYKNFETRFDAQVYRLNATCSGAELSPALASFLLLAISRITTQLVSILSAAAPTVREQANAGTNNADILSQISYNDIASILRACDEPKKPFQSDRKL